MGLVVGWFFLNNFHGSKPLVPGTLAPNKAQEQSQLPLCRGVSALRTQPAEQLSTGAPVMEEGRGKGNRDLVPGGETNGFTRTPKKEGMGVAADVFVFFFLFGVVKNFMF